MKRFVYISMLLAVLGSCGGGNSITGELTGVPNRKEWFEPDPYGMVFVPMGSYNMGPNDQDVPFAMTTQSKTVSIDPFWMDATEITNNEYRQFVVWVLDSIARRLLVKAGKEEYKWKVPEGKDLSADGYDPDNPDKCFLNWEQDLSWAEPEQDVADALKELYLTPEERFYRRKEIDTRKLIYEFYWVDLRQAAKKQNRYNYTFTQQGNQVTAEGKYEGKVFKSDGKVEDIKDRSAFIMAGKINIYPDTLVWMADYTYSFNEPYAKSYFWHPAFDTYPVVGINWKQAIAFCIWRTEIMRNWTQREGSAPYQDYRLPTESEWEYAARGGLALSMYPWGGPYTRNYQGCFIANFKNMRGNYGDDGANETIEVSKYSPNEYGLYDMAGNVAEWTSNAFDESAYSFSHDLNPDYTYDALANDPPALKRKVVRGGSWKDIAYYLQTGVKTYEYQDTAKSYIGFRCVRSYMGRDAAEWESERRD